MPPLSGKEMMQNGGPAPTTAGRRETPIPPTLQVWRRIHRLSGRLLPEHVSITVLTILLLTSLRFAFAAYLEKAHGWPADADATPASAGKHLATEASASLVATFHSLCLVPGLVACFLWYRYSPSERLDAAPRWWQEAAVALIQFCTGYMIYDGFWNILVLHYPAYEPSDWMFLGHHLATTVYMSSARYIGAAHGSAMMCMLLGEITNPLQNLYYVTQYAMMLACCNGPRMGFANAVVEVLFCGAYLVLRALVMPVAGMHMTYKLATGRAIPSLLKVLYILLIWGVMIGSIPWIQDCWDTLQRRMSSTVSISSEL